MFKFMGLFVGLAVGGFGSTIRNTWPESQYHNQDSLGSYRYGYTSPYHSKSETRENGITQGGYSYIDANGILQAVQYTADDVNGFRISGSNIPKQIENNERSDIAESQKNHIFQYNNNNNNENTLDANDIAKNNNEINKNPYLLTQAEASGINVPVPTNMHLINKPIQYSYYNGNNLASSASPTQIKSAQPVASSSWILPSLVPVSSYPAAAAFVPARKMHSSLHHTQDSLGQYDYTYTGDTSAKSESRSLDGTTRGAYSYIDANNILQQVHYIADHNGFRVLATNLP